MDIFAIFTLLGGLAMFLYGMNLMGDGLERMGGGKFESVLEKLTNNTLKGVILGAGITAVIQSSSATTVMVVGFVNSGIMKLSQAIGIIMGANVGTTITSWILSLTNIQGDNLIMNLLKPANFTPVLAFAGIVMTMASKKDKIKNVGHIFIGFAVLMFGMEMMSDSVKPLADVPEFTNILVMFKNPVMGVIVGALLTAVIQSSSASVGILQALSVTGAISFGAAIPIILGQNIGTCVTALISCIGANKNAKRAAMVHLYFNIIGTLLFLILFYTLNAIIHFSFVDASVDAFSIAIVHTIFNLVTTTMLLPFKGVLEKLAVMSVKDTNKETTLLDERFLQTPSYAIERCMALTSNMGYIAREAVSTAVSMIEEYSEKQDKIVVDYEAEVDHYEDLLGSYLVKLSSKDLSVEDSQRVSLLLHAIGDFEQITDIAVKLLYIIREIHQKKVTFSDKAKCELEIVTNAIFEIMDLTIEAFSNSNLEAIDRIESLESVIDGLKKELKNRHIHRLRDGRCSIETGFVFSDYVSSLEKISDHCSNIAVSIEQLIAQNYELHQSMHEKKTEAEYKEMYMHYSKKYALPFSTSGMEREAHA